LTTVLPKQLVDAFCNQVHDEVHDTFLIESVVMTAIPAEPGFPEPPWMVPPFSGLAAPLVPVVTAAGLGSMA